MSGVDLLWLVYQVMPAAVLLDLLIFTFGIVAVRRWQARRR